jgi:hypothetical protein
MTILRFVFPFLFVRNWHDGSWEFSRARCVLFLIFVLMLFLGIVIAYNLQAPVVYSS